MNTTEAQTIANIVTTAFSSVIGDITKLVAQTHANHMEIINVLPAEERKALILAEMASSDKMLAGMGAGWTEMAKEAISVGKTLQAQEALRGSRPDKRAEAELVSAEARLIAAKAEALRVANQMRQWETERADRLADRLAVNGTDSKAEALRAARAKVPVGEIDRG